jgi:hypothetical protein
MNYIEGDNFDIIKLPTNIIIDLFKNKIIDKEGIEHRNFFQCVSLNDKYIIKTGINPNSICKWRSYINLYDYEFNIITDYYIENIIIADIVEFNNRFFCLYNVILNDNLKCVYKASEIFIYNNEIKLIDIDIEYGIKDRWDYYFNTNYYQTKILDHNMLSNVYLYICIYTKDNHKLYVNKLRCITYNNTNIENCVLNTIFESIRSFDDVIYAKYTYKCYMIPNKEINEYDKFFNENNDVLTILENVSFVTNNTMNLKFSD